MHSLQKLGHMLRFHLLVWDQLGTAQILLVRQLINSLWVIVY